MLSGTLTTFQALISKKEMTSEHTHKKKSGALTASFDKEKKKINLIVKTKIILIHHLEKLEFFFFFSFFRNMKCVKHFICFLVIIS